MFAPAGPDAAALAEVGWVLVVAMALVFAGVMALTWRALRTPPHEPDRRRWVLGGGVLFPVAVLSALLVYAVARTGGSLAAAPRADTPVVTVIGHSWWWEVRYGGGVVLANELRLPVGRPVLVGLESADVVHAFWVPALGGKVDLVPGRVHRLTLHADRAGTWRGQCAEFCGEQHARMALHVVALPPAEFETWLAAQAAPAAEPTEALAVEGRRLFVDQRCTACHAVRGLSDARLGPDLTHVGSRLTIGAGTLPLRRDTLAAWIRDVQAHKPGARMPSYGRRLDEAQLEAIAAYLEQLN